MRQPRLALSGWIRRGLWLPLLAAAVLFTHGFHPYADDGGLYLAATERLMDPTLYQQDAAFLLPHTQFSIFGHALALLARETRCPLDWIVFIAYIASVLLFLLGCERVAAALFDTWEERAGALLAGAALFTLPVAGTALSIMDPYLTARSFSTPLELLAVAACLAGRIRRCILFALFACSLHPLMAVYLAAFLAILRAAQHSRWRLLAGLCAAAVAVCGVANWVGQRQAVSAAYRNAALSRTYFFLANWAWFEWLGVVLPLTLLSCVLWRRWVRSPAASVVAASAAAGVSSVACALLFVHRSGPYLLARFQPLREWQIIYLLGVLLLGAWAGRMLFRRDAVAAWLAFGCLFLGMFAVSRHMYGNSRQVAWPGRAPRNDWVRAFVWIRAHTPTGAVIAADPMLVFAPGEDAQNLRAVSRRTALADYKDGGVAAISPAAAPQWEREWDAQQGIVWESDSERIRNLRPFGVNWIVLPAEATTALLCPYRNRQAKVCRLG